MQQRCIKLIKSDSKDIYKVTNLCFKLMLFFLTFFLENMISTKMYVFFST